MRNMENKKIGNNNYLQIKRFDNYFKGNYTKSLAP